MWMDISIIVRSFLAGCGGKRAQKGDQRAVDLAGSLLLGPVATAWKHDRVLEVGDKCAQIGEDICHTWEVHHQVPVAGEKKC